jgi:alpha-beta hydrolase superfamily lysophospholipase
MANQGAPRAEFLLFDTEDKVTLNALLYLPDTPTKNTVIYVPGMTGGFSGLHDYGPMAARLSEIGYALLVPNQRTACLHGMLFARFADYVTDIRAVVEIAKSRGLAEIALFGTSLGGPRIINYWRATKEPAIKALGFVSSIKSPYLEAQIRFDAAKRADFDAHLAKCRALVKEGRGREMLTYEDWFPERDMNLAAHVFVDIFGTLEESDASTVKFGHEVTIPAVVIHGTADDIALMPNAEAIYESLKNAPKRDLIRVEGGNHFLTRGRIAEDYAKAVSGWLGKNLPAKPG